MIDLLVLVHIKTFNIELTNFYIKNGEAVCALVLSCFLVPFQSLHL